MLNGELTSDAITADFRILQRRRGHRYSLDDVAVAWQAANDRPDARRYLDLGCGIGSVLLMVGWKLPRATLTGIEALPESAELAERSAGLNGLASRTTIVRGDFRDRALLLGPCDLVSGTPPYLPPGSALVSPDPQRAAARIELRGGIEAYLSAAAAALAEGGLVVVCADGRRPDRVIAGATAADLVPLVRRDVIPRAARPPLFSVWTLARAADRRHGALAHEILVVRDGGGEQTAAARALRAFFGLS